MLRMLRTPGVVVSLLLVLCVVAAALVVYQLGVKDTAERLGRIGLALLRTFANIVGG